MGTMLSEAGPFGFVVFALGIVTLGVNVAQFARRGRVDYGGAILGLIAATFLVGVCGTGMGMYMAGTSIAATRPDDAIVLLALSLGIASTTTVFGALWAAINAVLFGLYRVLTARASALAPARG